MSDLDSMDDTTFQPGRGSLFVPMVFCSLVLITIVVMMKMIVKNTEELSRVKGNLGPAIGEIRNLNSNLTILEVEVEKVKALRLDYEDSIDRSVGQMVWEVERLKADRDSQARFDKATAKRLLELERLDRQLLINGYE